MKEIEAIWEKIEAWYAAEGASHLLRPGASEVEISKTEQTLGLTFPPEFKASLQRHNGSTDSGWPFGTLLGLESIESEERVWRDLLDDGTFDAGAKHDASQGGGQTQRGWWVRGWIPLDADGAGNGAVIDTVPGPQGTVGQILDMDHEVGPSGPTHPSLVAYLEDALEELHSPDCVFREDGLYSPDELNEENDQ